ncbi:MAG: hypothetical protein ACREDR_42775 [Blastocatellia bacterium]
MSQYKPIEEHKFLTGLDIIPKTAKLATAPAPVIVNPLPVVGTWLNVDKSTQGIVKLILSETGADLFVELFGACVPTPCDWGKVKAVPYSVGVCVNEGTAFTAHFNQGFAERIVTGTLNEGALFLEVFTVFHGTGRDNYYLRETFYRP